MTVHAVQVDRLGHRYGQHTAVHDLSLAVRRGEIVGLFGANGAGKTTTFKALAGLLTPTSGSVRLLGKAVAEALDQTVVLFDPPAFYPNLTALSNLEVALAFADQKQTRAQLLEILQRVGLTSLNKRVGEFSQGMKKRLSLALALAKNPRVLLLDEPTNGLDLDGVELFEHLLREMVGRGAACLISTHEWDVAERLVDRVVILDQGRIVCSAPLSDLVAPTDQWLIRSDNSRVASILEATPGVSIVGKGELPGEFIVSLHDVPIEEVTERLVDGGCAPRTVSPHRQPLASVYKSMVNGR